MARYVRFTIQGGSNEEEGATDGYCAVRNDFDRVRSGWRRVRFGALRAAPAAAIRHRRGCAGSGLRLDRWILGSSRRPLDLGGWPMDASTARPSGLRRSAMAQRERALPEASWL